MRVAIYSRVIEEDQHLPLQLFFEALRLRQIEPVLYAPFYQQIKDRIDFPAPIATFSQSAELTDGIEVIISLGGDGTLLDTITLIRDKKIAVMGINFGRLGFLAGIGKDQVDVAVKAVAERTYIEDKRSLIHLDSVVA